MPVDAIENRVLDSIKAELLKIGVPPANYLTVPSAPKEGVPGDALPGQSAPQLYYQHVRTSPNEPEAGTASHYGVVHLKIWCASSDPVNGPRTVNKLKADVLRVLYAAEGTFQSAYKSFGIQIGEFAIRDDMATAGMSVCEFAVDVPFVMDHASP